MTASIDAELQALSEEFDLLGGWEEQMSYVIDMGKALPPLPPSERTDANRVQGCTSPTWLSSARGADGRLVFRGESEAFITRGLVALLLRLLSERRPQDILRFDIRAAMGRLGLDRTLTPARSNGLASMVERIYREAAAAAA